ncbi:MAG: beta-N-acetylhexosaminidase [Roseburia sp.]|nr:beta-N-acetylhexosaminidase [Roseburia sp.]
MREELTSREKRRRRRIRNQILAYLVLAVFAILVITGGYFGVKKVVGYLEDYNRKVSDAMAEAESDAENEPGSDALQEEPSEPYSEPEPEPSALDPLDELVEGYLQNMTLEQMVAGMFMVSPEAITGVQTAVQAGAGTETAIQTHPVGGLIYARKNFISEEQFRTMLANTNAYAGYPLFLAVSRECGKSTDFGIEATAEAEALTDAAEVQETYAGIAGKLAGYGINMNLAPVAEVVPEDGDAALRSRVFGSDAATVAPLVSAAVQAMQDADVSAVLQKFPGTGAEAKSMEELSNSEFIIYNAAIQSGVDCIMVSHVSAQGATGADIPSSLSATMITDVLRNTMGFQGVVITDWLNDSAITGRYGSAEAAVMAINAGADILLEPEDYQEAYEGVLQAVQDGTITQERIQESLRRIYRLKYKYVLANASEIVAE